MEFLEDQLQKRRKAGLWRCLSSRGRLIDLTSNDYFGFARSIKSITVDQLGATGSRLLTGNHPLYRKLEEQLAAFHRADACLIYNSGYTANLGLLAAIGTREGTFVHDLEVHASIYDGMRLSHAKCLPFRHNDLDSLTTRLKRASPPVFVLIESVYSMSGDRALLPEIADLCRLRGAALIVDEAHATGIHGSHGEGLVVELGLEAEIFARVHTFSKALGTHGAAVMGSKTLKDYLLNFSRPFIYTTALPPPTLAMIACAYEKLRKQAKDHQQRLTQLAQYFRSTAYAKGIALSANTGPIQPLYFEDVETVQRLSKKLQEAGLDVRAIVPPTVSRGKACLRVVLHSFNRKEEIAQLVELLS